MKPLRQQVAPVCRRGSCLTTGLSSTIGGCAGAVVLTKLALAEHVARYDTAAEFWEPMITVPVGIVVGAVLGPVLTIFAQRLLTRKSVPWRSTNQLSLPLNGRWLAYLVSILLPIAIFYLSLLAVFRIMLLCGLCG